MGPFRVLSTWGDNLELRSHKPNGGRVGTFVVFSTKPDMLKRMRKVRRGDLIMVRTRAAWGHRPPNELLDFEPAPNLTKVRSYDPGSQVIHLADHTKRIMAYCAYVPDAAEFERIMQTFPVESMVTVDCRASDKSAPAPMTLVSIVR